MPRDQRDKLQLPSLQRHESFRAKPVKRAAQDPDGDAAADAQTPLDMEARTLTLTFSSELPVDRWWGTEILSHDPDAANLERLNDGAPLLFNHDMDQIIGVVESAEIGPDRRGHAVVRFASNDAGTEAMNLVAEGVLRNVSFAYRISKVLEDVDEETFTAIDWEAFEISLVSVPADASIGVGRAEASEAKDVFIQRSRPAPATAETVTGDPTMKLRHVYREEVREAGAGGGGAALPVVVDAQAVRNEALEQERVRVSAILTYAEKLGCRDLGKQLIESGKTIDEARSAFLDHVQRNDNAQKPAATAANIDLTPKEARGYSLIRAVNALVNDDWAAAGFEREVSIELGKQREKIGIVPKGKRSLFMPTNLPFQVPGVQAAQSERMREILAQRAIYQVGTAVQGGNLVATQLLAGSFIEVLRNLSVTAQLGARFLTGLVGNVDIPRQSGQTGTYWVAESGAVTEAEATFDKVSLRPKTIGALSKVSRLMLLQATPDIEMIAREDLLAVIALGLDLAAISGTGASNQPLGIANQSGIGSVVGGTNGANFTFDHIIQLYSALRVGNAPQKNLGYAINAKTYGYLSSLKSSTGSYLWMPQGGIINAPGDTLRGYPYAISNQLRSNLVKGASGAICSEVIYGNWNELLIGEWGSLELAVNPYDSTGFTTGDVILRAFQTCDVQLRHAASFAYMSDGLTPGF